MTKPEKAVTRAYGRHAGYRGPGPWPRIYLWERIGRDIGAFPEPGVLRHRVASQSLPGHGKMGNRGLIMALYRIVKEERGTYDEKQADTFDEMIKIVDYLKTTGADSPHTKITASIADGKRWVPIFILAGNVPKAGEEPAWDVELEIDGNVIRPLDTTYRPRG